MLFEEFNSKGKRIFFTESKECIPSKKELEYRNETNGHTYKMDGKDYSVSKKEKK